MQSKTISEYCNPLDVLLADPYALYHEGTYYLYATSSPWEGYAVWTSPDLINWQYQGLAFKKTASSWGKYNFWAPEVVEKDGTFYMFYSAHGGDTSLRICLATSPSPLGPFRDVKAPYFDDGMAYIDAHCFFDSDGTPYLYYVKDMSENPTSEIWVCQMTPDLLCFVGDPVSCMKPEGGWEGRSWTEGPFLLKHENTYYMMYSGSGYFSNEYSVGYATSVSPLGPWNKYRGNPILTKTEKVSGPGHNSVVQSPDGSELFAVYHTHQSFAGGGSRQLAIDRLTFEDTDDGPALLKIDGPTVSPQAFPSGATPAPSAKCDNFKELPLSRSHWTIFNENIGTWRKTDSAIEITMEKGSVAEANASLKNLFLQYAPQENNFEIIVTVHMEETHILDHAFLMIWGDHNNYIQFSKTYATTDIIAVAFEKDGALTTKVLEVPHATDFHLKISKSRNLYRFFYSENKTDWTTMSFGIENEFPQVKVGFGAASPLVGSKATTLFSDFRIVTPSETNMLTTY